MGARHTHLDLIALSAQTEEVTKRSGNAKAPRYGKAALGLVDLNPVIVKLFNQQTVTRLYVGHRDQCTPMNKQSFRLSVFLNDWTLASVMACL